MGYNLDLQALADELDFDLEDVQMLLEVFISSSSEKLKELEEAINSNNLEAIVEASHAIKGSSGNLMLSNIYEKSKYMEQSARQLAKIDYKAEFLELKSMISAIEG